MRSVAVVLLVAACALSAPAGAAPGGVVLDVGGYTIHEGRGEGLYLAGRVVRSLLRFGSFSGGVFTGSGTDPFAGVQLGVGLWLPFGSMAVTANVGAGVAYERADADGSLISTRHWEVGLESRVVGATYVRLGVRRGEHGSFGDAGTFDGPHAVFAGVRLGL